MLYLFFFKSVAGLMQNALWLKMHKKVNMTNYIGTRCISELGRDCYEGLIPQTDTVGDRLTPLSRTRNRVCIPFCWMAPTSVSSCHRPGLDGHISRVAKPPGKEHGTVRDWAHGMTEMAHEQNEKREIIIRYEKSSISWILFAFYTPITFTIFVDTTD